MPILQRPVEGLNGTSVETVNVSAELVPFHLARGYVEVFPVGDDLLTADEVDQAEQRAELEQQAAELTGAKLTRAAKAAGVEHPSTLTADEKRAAIVDQQVGVTDAGDGDTTEEND